MWRFNNRTVRYRTVQFVRHNIIDILPYPRSVIRTSLQRYQMSVFPNGNNYVCTGKTYF